MKQLDAADLDRLPGIRIREGAPLELPHILVLFDDPNDTVFGPLDVQSMGFKELYDFDLMQGSGHLTGFAINNETVRQSIFQALADLIDPDTYGATPHANLSQAIKRINVGYAVYFNRKGKRGI